MRGVPYRRPTEGRPRRESEEQGWSHFERIVLEKLEELADAITELGDRVTKIEHADLREAGAREVTQKLWKWVLGVAAALVIAALLALARGHR